MLRKGDKVEYEGVITTLKRLRLMKKKMLTVD